MSPLTPEEETAEAPAEDVGLAEIAANIDKELAEGKISPEEATMWRRFFGIEEDID